MEETIKHSVRIAWWNTSLAPLAEYRATEEERKFAISIIMRLLYEESVDCLALGEITADLLKQFVNAAGLEEFSFADCSTIFDRLKFDVGIIYRHNRIHLAKQATVIAEYGTSSLKVAQRLDLQLPQGVNPLHLFVVHWPSRKWCHENTAKRDTLGYSLRSAAQEVMFTYKYPPQMIFIGDFNDDPFDQSLAGHLLATRDRSRARHSPSYFYNPFWRYLGESHPYMPNLKCDSICGTYCQRSSSGEETQWRTFDQVILSHALINSYEWQLNEENTFIARMKPLDDIVRQRKNIFDHLPIISTIELMAERSA